VTTDVDQAVQDARAGQIRRQGGPVMPIERRPRRGRGGVATRVATIAIVNAAILIAAGLFGGIVMPLGMFGALAVMLAMLAATVLIAFAPATPVPTPERIARSDLKSLPAQTARWLDAQRPALPAPAVPLLDSIDRRLDTLGVQLAALDDEAPAALEIRRLVGEQLPEFIRDYQRVPAAMRTTPRNGKTPDQQLAEGLGVIDREIGEMSQQLAQGDLDSLATRQRYLEIKYAGQDGA
jgi:hypothetical protein